MSDIEEAFQEDLQMVIEDAIDSGESFTMFDDGGDVYTFESRGLLTSNKGLIVRLTDGREFQLTIVQSA